MTMRAAFDQSLIELRPIFVLGRATLINVGFVYAFFD
jgi:hypothetical protein